MLYSPPPKKVSHPWSCSIPLPIPAPHPQKHLIQAPPASLESIRHLSRYRHRHRHRHRHHHRHRHRHNYQPGQAMTLTVSRRAISDTANAINTTSAVRSNVLIGCNCLWAGRGGAGRGGAGRDGRDGAGRYCFVRLGRRLEGRGSVRQDWTAAVGRTVSYLSSRLSNVHYLLSLSHGLPETV